MTAHSVPIQEQKQQLGFSAKHLWLCSASREMLCQGGIWNYNCCGTDGSWSSTRKIPTPGLCCSRAEFFLGLHPGAAEQEPFPVSRPPWIWGLPCFVALWHLIWRPDHVNSCSSSSGLSIINHISRQRGFLQQEIQEQLQAGSQSGKGLHSPVEVQGSLGTEAREELFSSRMVKLASKITWGAKTPLQNSHKSHSSPRCLHASSTLRLHRVQSGVGRSGQQHFHINSLT